MWVAMSHQSGGMRHWTLQWLQYVTSWYHVIDRGLIWITELNSLQRHRPCHSHDLPLPCVSPDNRELTDDHFALRCSASNLSRSAEDSAALLCWNTGNHLPDFPLSRIDEGVSPNLFVISTSAPACTSALARNERFLFQSANTSTIHAIDDLPMTSHFSMQAMCSAVLPNLVSWFRSAFDAMSNLTADLLPL